MNLWRYTAVAMNEPSVRRVGELSAESPADLRATLRRAGLQVIYLKPVRHAHVQNKNLLKPLADRWHKHLRTRRRNTRAELYDSLATMLESGLPLADAIETLLQSRNKGRSPLRSLLSEFRGKLREGAALSEAMKTRQDWFEGPEVAMVEAAQQSGELGSVLRSLAARQQQAEALMQKLIAALAYPAVVSAVALAVVVFMSTRTLPQLAALLIDNQVPVPGLTSAVMGFGQWVAGSWMFILLGAILLPIVWGSAQSFIETRFSRSINQESRWRGIPQPAMLRRITVAGFCSRLAELLRAGIPLVEALRVVAPTISKRNFREHILRAAEHIEHGSEPAEALADDLWLDAEFVRLVELGQHTGELDTMLQRLADRYQRQAVRLIERFTRVLEPLVIVILAALVGIVVMAAILPLVRLQEIV